MKLQLTLRDVALLKSMWKWKVLTGAAIWKVFFYDRDPNTCYQRLLQLKKGGYIDLRSTDAQGSGHVWTLSQKGFTIVRQYLPDLREEGFLSENVSHDVYVTAAHAGDWLIHRPSEVELFSEQELRRIDLDRYPEWVPRSELHRPDGYWRIKFLGHMVAIALEVELSQKSAMRYRLLSNFYQQEKEILRVVWVVGDSSLARAIRAQLKEANPGTLNLHNFLLLCDFQKLGWSAPFILGCEQGHPLHEMLNGGLRHVPATCTTADLLDFRKAFGKSRGCKVLKFEKPGKTSDRLPILPNSESQ